MGKASRKRRERMEQVQQAREIEGLVKRARFYDELVRQSLTEYGEYIKASVNVDLYNVEHSSDQLMQPIMTNVASAHLFLEKPLDVIDASGLCGHIEWDGYIFDNPPKFGLVDIHHSPLPEVFVEYHLPYGTSLFTPDSYLDVTDVGIYLQYAEDQSLPTSVNAACFYRNWQDGSIESLGSCHIIFDENGEATLSTALKGNAYDRFIVVLYWAFYAIQFLNCRNIVTVDHEPDPADNETYQRHFGVPMTTYKTLAIKPMGKRYERDGESNAYQDIMPLHIRRGHFKTFTTEHPRFGYNHPSNIGTFWHEATAVGDAKNGIRVKDYEVKP